ncbi:MAG: general secretion pathway protein GspC [Proteobacteria bacterium]|nr:general secretion pathway protein GspC [Pseudomonadota bacterium]
MLNFKLLQNLYKEPKKLIALLIAVLASFALILELVSFLRFFTKDKIIEASEPIVHLKPLTPQSSLFSSALFGNYVPKDLSKAVIKESMLNFKLMGVLYSATKNESQAIISDGNNERYYFIGDTLPGGAVIKAIRKNSVVVLYDGTLESISLQKNKLEFEPQATPLIKD